MSLKEIFNSIGDFFSSIFSFIWNADILLLLLIIIAATTFIAGFNMENELNKDKKVLGWGFLLILIGIGFGLLSVYYYEVYL